MLNFLELRNSSTSLALLITQQFEQFSLFQPPRTHEILSYDSISLNSCVFRTVWLDGTTLNSWTISYDPTSLNYSVVQAVQQGWTIHRTHEMFSYDLCSLNYSVVQAVPLDGTTLNSWTIAVWFFFPRLLSSSRNSTALNYTKTWNVLLWALFPQLLSGSSSSLDRATLNSWNIVLLSPFLNYVVVQAVQQRWTIHRTYEILDH